MQKPFLISCCRIDKYELPVNNVLTDGDRTKLRDKLDHIVELYVKLLNELAKFPKAEFNELWNKLDDKTKTKMLKELGIKDEHNAENLKKSFMELGKQDGYGKSDFREYLSPEINSHYGLPTKWYDKS